MHTHRVTSWDIWVSIWATAYGESNGWQTDIRLGESMSILASWLAAWTIFQSTLNVLRCHGYGQIIWQKVCEVWRESMFGWDPDWSGSQEWESSYWMDTEAEPDPSLEHYKWHTILRFQPGILWYKRSLTTEGEIIGENCYTIGAQQFC